VSRDAYTLMAVHAHPDDESSGTGGLLRLTALQGHTTVLVTCTNGELGEVKVRGQRLTPVHCPADRARLAAIRRQELARAASTLGITHLYMLGYHDSGMAGWDTNTAAHAFARADMDEAVGRLVGIIRQHRPDVAIAYDEQGGYGHPDHIMAHRVTMAALDAAADAKCFPDTGTPWQVPKVYYTAWARSDMLRAFKLMHYLGRQTPLRDPDFDPNKWGCPDDLITTRIDIRPVMGAKWQALFSHRSQMGGRNFFWWFMRLAGRWAYPFESLRCIRSPQPIHVPESDVFSGLAKPG
jgi:LmbE family N-acetylglucosaminyl deacetylase